DSDRARAGRRPRDPRPAQDAHQDVLLVRAVLRRGPEHAHLPGLPRSARLAAGGQRPGDPLRADDGDGIRLRHRRALDLPPQELLLSRPVQGLPDLPVRRAAVHRRAPGRRADPPHPPRGGRREARPRRRVGAHPRVRFQRGRLQPRRHAVGRDGHRARPALGGGGARLAHPAARDAAPARRLGRQHGGGVAALRRQRLRASARLDRARDQDRAQEHELVPLRDAGHQRGGRPPDRAGAGRRARGPGDAALRPGHRAHLVAALEGGGARLPLLPGAGPGTRRPDRRDARPRPECDPRIARDARGPLRARLLAAGRHRPPARLRAALRRLLRARRERRRRRPARGAGQLGDRAADPHRRGRRPGRVPGRARGARRARRDGRSTRDQRQRGTPGARRPGRRGRQRPRGGRARGSGGDGLGRRARFGGRRRAGRQSRCRREGPRRQRQGDGPDRRPRDARDQGTRRRRRGRPAGPRAARHL
ncbi:MAG: Aspartyl-tRNA(Asn) amidotransferase subunit B @ Glutamyl-tRNA(Gln) amidotransferase subunit B, partial [uncultured Solirubrobacteraceae bacterium]